MDSASTCLSACKALIAECSQLVKLVVDKKLRPNGENRVKEEFQIHLMSDIVAVRLSTEQRSI
jgi:hypothetical protein